MKTIKVQSKNKQSVFFEIEIDEAFTPYNQYLIFKFLNMNVSFEIVKGQKGLVISVFNTQKQQILSFFKENFNVALKSNANTVILLTDKSYADVELLKADFEKRKREYIAKRNQLIDELPVKYYMYDSFDWGDYTSDKIRKIKVLRDKLYDENYGSKEGIVVKEYNFNNKSIGNYEAEWIADLKKTGGKENDSKLYEIPAEFAQKWIDIHIELINIELAKEAEEQKLRAEAAEREEQRKKACFEEAKETDKPVLLYSYFLSGSQIPRKFRDEDSDMGNLLTYAMPDGSIKERFSHAY